MRAKRTRRKEVVALQVFFAMAVICQYNAAAVNWNSIEVNDIEYYMQTDKSVYDLGENVEMLYRVTNLGTEDVTFAFSQSPEWNFWVEKDEEDVWMAVQGWWAFGTAFTLAPNEYKEYPYLWDMRDTEGILVGLGGYNVIGGFDAGTSISSKYWEFTEVAVPITITPEPCSLTLFVAGLYILHHFNKKRRN